MAEPCLQGPRIMPGVRKGEAARVPKHVRVDRKSVRSANQERKTLPVTSDKKGALSIARRRAR